MILAPRVGSRDLGAFDELYLTRGPTRRRPSVFVKSVLARLSSLDLAAFCVCRLLMHTMLQLLSMVPTH
jgi:hypothetical protein